MYTLRHVQLRDKDGLSGCDLRYRRRRDDRLCSGRRVATGGADNRRAYYLRNIAGGVVVDEEDRPKRRVIRHVLGRKDIVPFGWDTGVPDFWDTPEVSWCEGMSSNTLKVHWCHLETYPGEGVPEVLAD